MYYNGDALDIPGRRGLGLGFIDDIAIGVKGLTDKGNAQKVLEILEDMEGCKDRHGTQFEPSKYQFMHCTRNAKLETSELITMTNGVTIQPTTEARYLGITFDKSLRFKSHLQNVAKKGTKFVLAMTNVGKSTWGAHF